MLFKLISEHDSVYYYDNMTSLFYDRFNNLVKTPIALNNFKNRAYDSGSSLKNDEYFHYHTEGILPKTNKVFDVKNIHRLEITVGFKCNYRCKYCVQSYCHKDESSDFEFSKFVEAFEKSNLLSQIYTIKLTGGEPLLYFDRVKAFVKYFREDLNFNKPISLVTNGELFDKEKLEFCLKNKIYVFFSHDAHAQTYYRNKTDYLDNKKVRECVIEQIRTGQYDYGLSNSGCFGFTVNPKAYNLQKALDWFNEHVYEGVAICPYLVTEFDSYTEHLLNDWTPETLNEAKESFLKAYLADKSNKYYNYYYRFRETLERTLYRLVNAKPAATQLGRCPAQISSGAISVDWNGNMLSCWGMPYSKQIVDGHLSNLKEVVFHHKTQQNFSKDFCKSCPYILSCGGNACPFLDEKSHEIKCKSLQPFLGAQAEAAFALYLGEKIKEIIPCVP